MNNQAQVPAKAARRRGLALIVVIGALALATMLLLAMFSLTETEYRATQSYVSALTAKQFADVATAVVQAQIQNGQNTRSQATQRTIHSTQPGCVRVYSAQGLFQAAYKLYSSSQMRVTGTSEAALFAADQQVPGDWDTMPARYVDLNEPVVRPALAGAGAVSVYFPVIDPRAAFNDYGPQYTPSSPPPAGAPTSQVEGFWYSKTTPPGAGGAITYNTVTTPSDTADATRLRLPMPVEWLYLLQDGTMGTLDSSNTFVSADAGSQPSTTNPIVGRVAFWTDDESCKININTASEPTFFAPPFYYHDRDRRWANFPGASAEYQRYPGHPATVALSTVLAPNFRLDAYSPEDDKLSTASQVVQIKEYIYNMIPKVSVGGSQAGTLPFVNDDFSRFNGEGDATAQKVETAAARAERLFASVDEMLFKDGEYDPSTGRVAARYTFPGSSRTLFDHNTLERSRFFLTAHSRAPEFSIYGLPRVCIWPVADGEQSDNKKRTNFDNMIALCATLRNSTAGQGVANSYIFRRAEAHHSTYDVTGTATGYPRSVGLQRNSKLLDYLVTQMSGLSWPQIGSNLGAPGSPTFATKYGDDNVRQLAVQFFDYVRTTNLYDGILARGNDGMSANGKSGSALYEERDRLEASCLTYTNQRITPAATNVTANPNSSAGRNASDDAGVLPGHGQVSPSAWESGGKTYMGFGRMFTLSEVGFQFICTADGKLDEYAVDFDGTRSGGGTAPRTDPQTDSKIARPLKNSAVYGGYTLPTDSEARWYSNFPPLSQASTTAGGWKYGVKTDSATSDYHPSKHPGYDPENWNLSLPLDTPLAEDEKRIQAVFLMESFCPALGWTKMHPEYAIVVDGDYINQIKIKGLDPTTHASKDVALFDTAKEVVVKSNGNLYESSNVHSMGGHSGPSAMVGGRGGRPVSGQGTVVMGSDRTWISGNDAGHNALSNYGLTSNFITIKRNEPMQLTFPTGELVIRIYDKHDWKNRQPIQKISVRFSGLSTIPPPRLAYNGYSSSEFTYDNQPEGKGRVTDAELNFYSEVDSFGNIKYWRSKQGPHWWCYNYEGCLGRVQGRVNPAYTDSNKQPFWLSAPAPYPPGALDNPIRQALRGRLDTAAKAQWGPPGTEQGMSIIPSETVAKADGRPTSPAVKFESDVIRTLVPAVGDYRMVAARYDVPSTMWKPHPSWDVTSSGATPDVRTLHSFTTFWGDTEPGYILATSIRKANGTVSSDPKLQLVADVPYTTGRQPDLPPERDYAQAANSYGDFDAGIANAREGPYINKPDEGNFYAGTYTRNNITKYYRSGYFFESWHNSDDWRSGVFMTPNRLISSPVMFGSLPTGIWSVGGVATANALSGTRFDGNIPARPWQTLLFRPYVQSNLAARGSKTTHPGDIAPKDHYLLDMFFMPVVEPYAISEPLSVAGKINLNYQIMPFTNIRRATALHALMKGEFITAIPNGDVVNAKNFKSSPTNQNVWDTYYDEKTTPKKFWHRPIDVPETLVQFDEKFNLQLTGLANGLFRSASQICEMHLIPDTSKGLSQSPGESLGVTTLSGLKPGTRQNAMRAFWQNHSATGDNVRERPYSNLYSRLTTRSNTFRVHVRAQTIKKARSTNPAVFDPERDAVTSEYRGSTLLERFIDPNDTQNPLPDYAATATLNQPPLDTFYQFRVLESKRFNP